MEELKQTFDLTSFMTGDTWGKFLLSCLVVVVLWTISRVTKKLLRRSIKDEQLRTKYYWSKGISYTVFALSVLLLSNIWFSGIGSIGTFLGLIGAGLAIALQDPIVDIVAWMFIAIRRPFSLGDRVEIDGTAGDVVDIGVFTFAILEIGNWVDADQSTGRVIQIPNKSVFNKNVANYSQGLEYIWDEVNVLITFESDWKKAKEILFEIAEGESAPLSGSAKKSVKEAANRYMISYKTLTPTVYTDVKDSGIQLTIRFLCEPRKRRGRREKIWEAILDRFEAEEGRITLAYPTFRVER